MRLSSRPLLARIAWTRFNSCSRSIQVHISRQKLQDAGFGVRAEDGAEGLADFADGGVGANGIQDIRHGVFLAFGHALERVERALNRLVIALRFKLGELGELMTLRRL